MFPSRGGRRTTPSATAPDGFYGWRIVALTALLTAMTAPGQTVGVSVFVDPMIAGLELSRSQVSLAYLVGTLAGAMTLPVLGSRIDRHGVRRTTIAIGLAFGAALVAMAGVAGFLTLLLGFFGIRMLGQGALTLTASTSVALWFDRRRGTAVGLSSAGGQALMSLAPLALAVVVGGVGWRSAWVVSAAVVWITVVPFGWLLHDAPAALGQRPDGGAARTAARRTPSASWTRAEAVRTPMFWLVAAAVTASGMIATGLAFHQISLLGERGLSVAEAAANFVPQTLTGLGATVLTGVLVDRIRPRFIVGGAMASLGAAMVLAQTATPGVSAVAFGVAVGAASGSIRAFETAAMPRFYGVGSIGAIRGLLFAMNVGATAFGPLVLAGGYDATGSYAPTLSLLLPIPLLIAITALFVPEPIDRSASDAVRST